MCNLFKLFFTISCFIVTTHVIAGDNPNFRYLQPEGMSLPKGSYGLGVVIEPGYRMAFFTGQTGGNADGTYSDDFEVQASNAFAAVNILLREAGMSWKDVVNLNVYLTDSNDLPIWARMRDKNIGQSRPAGTGVIVKSLAATGARVEIQIAAAQKVD